MKRFFRLLGIGFLRFVALLAFGVGVNNFEVSPLPEWTLIAFAYLVSAFMTYAFARWAFHPHRPVFKDFLWTLAVFLIVGTLWELMVYSAIGWVLGIPLRASLEKAADWRSAYVLAFHGLVIVFSFWHARRVHRHAVAEGLV